MRLLRVAVVERLSDAEKAVKAERERESAELRKTRGALPSPTSSSPQSAWLRSFVTHRALAAELAPLLRDLERRAADDVEKGLYATTLQEVHSAYYAQRHRLVFHELSYHVAELGRSLELTGLTRAAVAALTTLCSLETQLFDALFTSASASLLQSLLSSLSSVLYTALRPAIIQQTSIEALCEVIVILKDETDTQHAAAAGNGPTVAGAGDAYQATLRRLIHDCQERLSYRAGVLIRDDIAGYVHTDADSDWAGRMATAEEAARSKSRTQDAQDAVEAQRFPKDEKRPKEDGDGDAADGAFLTEWLHPALERTLLTLGKLYRCLEPSVFRILAQEAVQHCVAQLLTCAKLIAAQTPPADAPPSASPPLHSALFLIHQLLTLRAQLSPFPLELSSSVKQLDFSHMQSILPSLFSSSAKFSSFAELLQLSTPRVNEVRTDSKRSIDREVKAACERCIGLMTAQLIGPLLAFFARTAERQKQGKGNDGGAFMAELRALLRQLVGDAREVEGLSARMRSVRRVVHAYLGSAATERSLLAPVQRSLTDMMEQLRFFLETHLRTAADAPQEERESAQEMQRSIVRLDQVVRSFDG